MKLNIINNDELIELKKIIRTGEFDKSTKLIAGQSEFLRLMIFGILSIPSLQSFHDFKNLTRAEKLTKLARVIFENHSLTRASKLSLLFDQSCSFIFLTMIGITLPTDFALINICFVTFATFTSSFSFQLFSGIKKYISILYVTVYYLLYDLNSNDFKVSFYKFFIYFSKLFEWPRGNAQLALE